MSAKCRSTCAFLATAIVAETWQKRRVHSEGLGGSSVNASALASPGRLSLYQRSGRTMHATEVHQTSSAPVGHSLARAAAGFTVSATLLVILMVGLAAL